MSIYAIADLHLSLYKHKPMDIFGDNWKDHHLKIQQNWNSTVTDNDTVLVAGDISWAMNMTEFAPDLEFLRTLNGKKVFTSGNHDYWWASVQTLNSLDENMYFIRTNYYPLGDFAVCGTRGWVCPNDTMYEPRDEKIFRRECIRLEMSLQAAQKAGYDKFIVMLHYPPANDKCEHSAFMDIIEKYGVKTVVYGHLHAPAAHATGISGNVNGTNYYLTASDYLDFRPLQINIY
ncbi:MAG: metallophosphoesterase [Firmicutes bacterium]|nr:metallophosphoesterase [Bacillota bacterium]